jgi:hypothetical protein
MHQALQRVRNFKQKNLFFCVNKDNAFKNENIISTDYSEIEDHFNELMDERGHFRELPLWARNNYKYSILSENINYINQLALFCEYLRFQGYRILYCDYSDRLNLPWDGTKFIEGFHYKPSHMDADEYEALQQRCYDLTHEQKKRLECFRFEKTFHWIPEDAKYSVFNLFRSNPRTEYFHIMFNKEKYQADNDKDDGFETNCAIRSSTEDKYTHLNKLCQILKCRKIYELEYNTYDLVDNQPALLDWVQDVAKYYTLRASRGGDKHGGGSIKYINSIIKHVTAEFCGMEMRSSRTKDKDRKDYWKYTNYNYIVKDDLPPTYRLFKLMEECVAQSSNI